MSYRHRYFPSHCKEIILVLAVLLVAVTKYPTEASSGRKVYFGSQLEGRVQYEQGSRSSSSLRWPATVHTGSTVNR